MIDDSSGTDPAAVTMATIDCSRCGTHEIGFRHGGDGCDGLVARIDGEWRCVDCGVRIRHTSSCPNCGASGAGTGERVVVDLRPPVSTRGVRTTLGRRLATEFGDGVAEDETLTAVAQAHSASAVEGRTFGDGASRDLGERLSNSAPSLAGYASMELLRHPGERTRDGIVESVLSDLRDQQEDDEDWTHFGLGVAFARTGGVYVSLVLAIRAGSPDPRELERAVHAAVNDRRRAHGLDALSFDHHLAGVARAHSRDMSRRGFFAHTNPDGEGTADRYRRADHDPRPAGENIAKRVPSAACDVTTVAERVVDGWMDSRGHRENVLRPAWVGEGIGVFQGPDGTVFVTENFR